MGVVIPLLVFGPVLTAGFLAGMGVRKRFAISAGLTVALCLLALSPTSVWLEKQRAQVERVQKFRRDFVDRCYRSQGKILSFYKSPTSKICVGRDGRILESY